ncbi:MAG: zinc-ribbon domain-containing protein [Isosphaeraceae bacterium]
MKIFHCGNCDQLCFFENTSCVSCGYRLAYLSDVEDMGTLEPAEGDEGLWRSVSKGSEGRTYRLCKNDAEQGVCNWAVPADEAGPYCLSCRLTHDPRPQP